MRRNIIIIVVLFSVGMALGQLVRKFNAPPAGHERAAAFTSNDEESVAAHEDHPAAGHDHSPAALEHPAADDHAAATEEHPTAVPDPAPAPDVTADAGIPTPPASDVKKLTVGDANQFLREGNVLAAENLYDALSQTARGTPQLDLVCRRGICRELQGNFESALADYRAVVGPTTPRQVLRTAQLGQARILIGTQNADLAKPLLYDLIANSPSWTTAGDAVQKSAQQLLACVYANEAAPNTDVHVTHPAWLARPTPTFPVQDVIDLLFKPPAGNGTKPTEAVKIVGQSGKQTHELLMTILTDRVSVQELLQQLAQATHLQFEWSVAAKQETLARTTQIAVSRLSLPLILDSLLDSVGCVWEVDHSTIRISRLADIAAEDLPEHVRARAVRTLRQVISTYPDDASTPVAYLALANMSLVAGQTDEAIAAYERMVTLYPRNPIKPETSFNLARALMAKGDTAKAVESFYNVVDCTPGRKIEPLAYLYLGRILLEDGQAAKAIRPLSRAVALSSDRKLSNASILTLAAAYLFAQQPIAANQVLMEHSSGLQIEPDRDPAAFLAAVAGYRIATSPSQMQREGRRLLGSLPHVDPDSFFGNFGYCLIGKAYSELQLEGPATEVYEKAIQHGVKGFMGDMVTFELASLHLQRGELDKAQALLNKLKSGPRQSWALQSRLQLAEISYKAGKDQECLDACRQLLADTTNRVSKPTVLRIMGHVYQRQGDHEKAAMCFGGLVPTETVAGGAPAEGVVK